MDWALAIERNREALKGIVTALAAMLGLADGDTAARIPFALRRAVLRVLRPAESAVRRLIVIAARGLVVELPPARPKPTGRSIRQGGGKQRPAFPLFDPRKRFVRPARAVPRIHSFASDPTVAALWSASAARARVPLPPDGSVDASRLCLRLRALKLALDDLPRQAQRLARARARRATMQILRFKSPLRPGRPPGYRRKPVHEVDHILAECHGLARDALAPDSS
jgi:hypothetical protein